MNVGTSVRSEKRWEGRLACEHRKDAVFARHPRRSDAHAAIAPGQIRDALAIHQHLSTIGAHQSKGAGCKEEHFEMRDVRRNPICPKIWIRLTDSDKRRGNIYFDKYYI